MSDTSKNSNSETNRQTASGNVFSQLRHLATELESGIQKLHQELDSKKQKDEDDKTGHACAMNFLLHAKKDVASLQDKTRTKNAEFAKGNAVVDRVCELMQNVLAVHADRLENIESFVEEYGYKRPASVMNKSCTHTECGDSCDLKRCVEDDNVDRENSEDLEEEDGSFDGHDDTGTSPSCQTATEKSEKVRTPKLEDMLRDLSEDTVVLLRGALQAGSAAKQNLGVAVGSCFSSLEASQLNGMNRQRILTPEPPPLLTRMFTFNTGNQVASDSNDSHPLPSTPKLMTPGFKLSKKTTAPIEQPSIQNKTVSVHTPEPPALLTGMFTFNSQKGVFETKTTTATPATPESPNLLTPGFKLNSFSGRGVDNAAISGTKNPGASVGKDRAAGIMKTPEAPTLLMPGFKLGDFKMNQPAKKGGQSVRSLFKTPPEPVFRNQVHEESRLPRYAACSGTKENMLMSSRTTSLAMPEPPQLLLSHSFLSSHKLGHGNKL